MRLIDADKLPKYTGYALSASEVAKAVDNAPTVDAVPVCRCKDCRWFSDNWCNEVHAHPIMEDDFCSYGERRGGADDADCRLP